ncbi:hypothetical protein AB0K09_29055 [Streptomyces sp. NPDC049577]|uniref:hypothetical protein n=1 Tax=Streptomyces sp. NPDC049577 TaxID=3155153 RepID=UPI00341E3F04
MKRVHVKRPRRKAWACAALVSALVAGPGALPARAHGQDVPRPALVCAGNAAIRFSPGLTLPTRSSRLTGSARYTCTGTDPVITGAESVIKGSGETGCLSIDSTAVEWVTWNTGEHSKVVYRRHHLVQPAAGETLSLVDGTVVEGKFKGRPVGSPGVQITLDPLKCFADEGVKVIEGPSTLVFL